MESLYFGCFAREPNRSATIMELAVSHDACFLSEIVMEKYIHLG